MAKILTLDHALAQLKTQLAGGAKISDEAGQLLMQKTAGRAVLHMTGAVLDVAETLSAIEFCNETGETSGGDGCKTLSEVLAKPSGLPACGITGRALRGNKTTTTPVIDYTNMLDLYRETLAYAADAGKIGTDLHSAEMAVYQIQVKPTPPPPWPGLVKEWTTIRDAKDPTPSQAAQKARVLARLRFNKTGTPSPTVVSGLAGDAIENRPRQVHGPMAEVVDAPRPVVPPPPAPMPVVWSGAYRPKVVILVADECPKDASMATELRKHIGPSQRRLKYEIWSTTEGDSGYNKGEILESQIKTADIFLYLCSSDLFAGTVMGRYDLHQSLMDRFPGKDGYRHIPIMIRSASVPAPLSAQVHLPRSGKPVDESSSRDSAWVEIVNGISSVVEFLIENPAKRPRRS